MLSFVSCHSLHTKEEMKVWCLGTNIDFFDEVLGFWCHLLRALLGYALYGGFYKSKHNLLKKWAQNSSLDYGKDPMPVINPSLLHLLFLLLSHYISIHIHFPHQNDLSKDAEIHPVSQTMHTSEKSSQWNPLIFVSGNYTRCDNYSGECFFFLPGGQVVILTANFTVRDKVYTVNWWECTG